MAKDGILKKDTLLRAFIPADVDYDDVKELRLTVKGFNVDTNALVGGQDKDYGKDDSKSIEDAEELIEAICKAEKLKCKKCKNSGDFIITK